MSRILQGQLFGILFGRRRQLGHARPECMPKVDLLVLSLVFTCQLPSVVFVCAYICVQRPFLMSFGCHCLFITEKVVLIISHNICSNWLSQQCCVCYTFLNCCWKNKDTVFVTQVGRPSLGKTYLYTCSKPVYWNKTYMHTSQSALLVVRSEVCE